MKMVVAGAGYAGTPAANRVAKKVPGAETAAEIADGRPDLGVRLVGNRLAAACSDSARRQYLAGRPAVVVEEGATLGAEYGSRTATVPWLRGPK
ncbi:hypothetical protein [Streptomyces flavofungini]|uniref:Uncharacterized protein n=1 Tax=Streptomyces flavofungini TaxID=68200 RepID=A0ABS0XFT4_9ACTN|nr:hypothetical protein [Streptomyces flavofungini]MBJ3811714.1 hypothetical protein [Streptomyces flavofungini]GHC86986.1 hypothetical protein GCM10010349_73310 [Streptomyces flavofungini]